MSGDVPLKNFEDCQSVTATDVQFGLVLELMTNAKVPELSRLSQVQGRLPAFGLRVSGLFPLSLRLVEELLLERGIVGSHSTKRRRDSGSNRTCKAASPARPMASPSRYQAISSNDFLREDVPLTFFIKGPPQGKGQSVIYACDEYPQRVPELRRAVGRRNKATQTRR